MSLSSLQASDLRQLDDLTNRLMALRGSPSETESTWLYLDERLIVTWGDPGLRVLLREHFQHATTDLFLPQPLAVLVAEAFRSWRTNHVALPERTTNCRFKHGCRSYELLLEAQRRGGYRLVIVLTPGERFVAKGLGERGRLSHREKEAVYWVARGKTSPEIGIILQISPRTAEKHVHAALAKLGFENRLQLALACRGETMLARSFAGSARVLKATGRSTINIENLIMVLRLKWQALPLLLLVLLQGCSDAPDLAAVKSTFVKEDLPEGWELVNYKVEAKQDVGSKVSPQFHYRFIAEISAKEDQLSRVGTLLGTDVLKVIHKKGQKVKIHGRAVSHYSGGQWEGGSLPETDAPEGRPAIAYNPKHVIQGSSDYSRPLNTVSARLGFQLPCRTSA